MEKQKRWQFYLILAVIVLTLYNILPTLFFYAKPLKQPIDAPRAREVAEQIVQRVNALEKGAETWLYSFCELIGVIPTSIELQKDNPSLIEVTFKNRGDAQLFQKFLPNAGKLITFPPAQLAVFAGQTGSANKVLVTRQLAVHLEPTEVDQLFLFSTLRNADGQISDLYREITQERAKQLMLVFGGASDNATKVAAIVKEMGNEEYDEIVLALARQLLEVENAFVNQPALAKRYYASFAQTDEAIKSDQIIDQFVARLQAQKKRTLVEKESLIKASEEGELDGEQTQQLSLLQAQAAILGDAASLIQNKKDSFKGQPRLNSGVVAQLIEESIINNEGQQQRLSLRGRNPFVEALIIDWSTDKIRLEFYPDVQTVRLQETTSTAAAQQQGVLNQLIVNEIALASQLTDELITPADLSFAVTLNQLTGTESFLAFDLRYVAAKRKEQITDLIQGQWMPMHHDLTPDVFPLNDMEAFAKLSSLDQRLGLVVYAPASSNEASVPAGFKNGSIYVIAKGLSEIIQKYQEDPESNQQLAADINQLGTLLQQNGFIGYSGSTYGIDPSYSKDFIFELPDYYSQLLKATREDFTVKGNKNYALLDMTDVEQRLLTRNKIDDRIQEDLLKWKEAYDRSQVDITATSRYQVPAPTKNVFWENLKLTAIKYFRGDDRKILKWGLDLSGGKTVRIGLRDHNNRPVTDPESLKQAVNELYTRVNKMGVSERTIHIENDNIILDFPGSQGLSASELVKASAMYFHIVNEKFTSHNPQLKESVNRFLQNVWNEALVTNRKDSESINEIAWQHLGGENEFGELARPRSEVAKLLYDQGLRLVNPKISSFSHSFNDTLSAVGVQPEEDFRQWDGQTHPLIVIFHNYALEGANLANVNVGYDTTNGNVLSFGVKSSYEQGESGSPRDNFYDWTSQFAADKILGTSREAYGDGRGWRMAVILNGNIISMPSLQAALRDGGTITGRFSQREINQLAADLKAGSLSFTPQILSEENVSPELGSEERTKGIVASIVALLLVVLSMVGYYHFAGVVASVALFLNILIMWGVLQNLGAALSLPSIAGIVLTIGMAIDANVLVFERVREEFALSGRIGSAIQAGYKKAFNAIVDSNITTIIAAVILIQFDSGPVKGFAVALIVGIISSMFTSLFMTRYFFAGWVQNPQNKSLRMSQFFNLTNFDFLGQTRMVLIVSGIILVAGSLVFASQRNTMFGMDFTGGYSVDVEVKELADVSDYRLRAADALLAAGATTNDVQVRELGRSNLLRIQLGMAMEEPHHPFYGMPENISSDRFTYEYQHNPRITWVVDALQKGELDIPESQLNQLDHQWTVRSGQFSEQMRYNSAVGLALALLSVLIYITLRFEFKFAVGAVVGLIFVVIVTLQALALFHWLGLPVQIDMQVIGAIMTIIGYALNDTIIVFDRIREDIRLLRKLSFPLIVNRALNVTLSRTVMTSGTTLLVLLALLFLGGQTILTFSLVMSIGVVVGTFSSLFIASPVMVYFHKRELRLQHSS